MYTDVYSKPENYGLEIVGSIDWLMEAYGFDMTVVWRDKETQQLYYLDDSGCSCPSPYEDVDSKEMLTEVTKEELQKYLVSKDPDMNRRLDIANLMGRIV